MMFELQETRKAIDDVTGLAEYMLEKFKSPKAAHDFLKKYDREIEQLRIFPLRYRGLSFEYHGYEVRLKPFDTYHIFFVVDTVHSKIIILRVLKDRQNWEDIMNRDLDDLQ